ncbi:MAG: glycosyltransferase [Burkholderiaceae bacterium]
MTLSFEMLFSIITCTLNSASWLPESIDSVSAQEGVRVQRVFVDGGSNDGTLDIIAGVRGDKILVRDEGEGISAAMNLGARAATGDIIAHLHSDDVYVGTRALATVAAAFAREPDRQWLYGRCKRLIDGRLIDNSFVTKPFSWPNLIRSNIIPHPATFIRRDAFLAAGGFSTALRYTMDYDLWLRLARTGAPIQLSDYLAAFRVHDGSLSSTQIWPCHAECLRVRQRHAGRSPLEHAEHLARHVWRGWRMYRETGIPPWVSHASSGGARRLPDEPA